MIQLLILAKAILAMTIGFLSSVIFGLILIPILKKVKIKRSEGALLVGEIV